MKPRLLYFLLFLSLAASGQSELKRYVKKGRNNIRFYNVKNLDGIGDFLVQSNLPGRSVYYLYKDSMYIGVLNDFFFTNGERAKKISSGSNYTEYLIPNCDKNLFLYDERNNMFVLFMNALNNDKSLTDSVTWEELLMPQGTVEGYVFNNKHEYYKSFRIYPQKFNKVATIMDVKKEGGQYLERYVKSNCSAYSEDFLDKSLVKLMNAVQCVVQERNDDPKYKWHARPDPKMNHFIKSWSVTSRRNR